MDTLQSGARAFPPAVMKKGFKAIPPLCLAVRRVRAGTPALQTQCPANLQNYFQRWC
jgi:hypothetical protein